MKGLYTPLTNNSFILVGFIFEILAYRKTGPFIRMIRLYMKKHTKNLLLLYVRLRLPNSSTHHHDDATLTETTVRSTSTPTRDESRKKSNRTFYSPCM